MIRPVSLLILIVLSCIMISACVMPQAPSPCLNPVTPSIIPGREFYTPTMSSIPGLPLTPDPGSATPSSCQYLYRWTASDGLLLIWNPRDYIVSNLPDFRAPDLSGAVGIDNRTVYWTWQDPSLPASGRAVTITLEVLDPSGRRVLGKAERIIGWDGNTAVLL